MLNHNEILAAKFIRTMGGVADTGQGGPYAVPVFVDEGVSPQYANLLQSSQLMYMTLHLQFEALNKMIEVAEGAGLDELVPQYMNLQSGLNIGMRIATEGVEKVSLSLQNKKF